MQPSSVEEPRGLASGTGPRPGGRKLAEMAEALSRNPGSDICTMVRLSCTRNASRQRYETLSSDMSGGHTFN